MMAASARNGQVLFDCDDDDEGSRFEYLSQLLYIVVGSQRVTWLTELLWWVVGEC